MTNPNKKAPGTRYLDYSKIKENKLFCTKHVRLVTERFYMSHRGIDFPVCKTCLREECGDMITPNFIGAPMRCS